VTRGFAVLVVVASIAGCSLVVDPDDEPIRCAPSVPGSCPPGQACRADGTCGATGFDGGTPRDVDVPDGCDIERCNQIDDDCDGNVDEGHDVDGDGFTWCGDGISPASADCDDMEMSTRPGGTEVCDLSDNDCDGATDESPNAICGGGQVCSSGSCYASDDCRLPTEMCMGGQVCNTMENPARCITPGCTPADCTSPEVCDPISGDCITPLPPGSACTSDRECTTDLCVSQTLIGLTSVPARMCTQACCTDSDCPADAICYASGLGPKLCVPVSMTSLTGIGTGGAGASCTDGPECRSGRCFTDMTCLAQCANDGQCESLVCQAQRIGTARVLTTFCDPPFGEVPFAGPCFFDDDCQAGLCVGSVLGQCTRPCRTSSDCGPNFCSYVSRGGGWVAACLGRPHSGMATTGSVCGSSDECNDRVCYEGRCASTCCSNTDCPGATDECKPVPVGSHYEMHCVP
jgi:hypothetical protein